MDTAILTYATLVVSILLLLASAVPKVLGPIGVAAQEWSERRRSARIAARAADLDDLQKELERLSEARKADRREHEAQRERDRIEHEAQRARDRKEYEEERRRDAAELHALKEEFAEYRRRWAERESRWRVEYQNHRRWDYRAQEALIGRDPPFDLSPPFMSPDPPEPTNTNVGN